MTSGWTSSSSAEGGRAGLPRQDQPQAGAVADHVAVAGPLHPAQRQLDVGLAAEQQRRAAPGAQQAVGVAEQLPGRLVGAADEPVEGGGREVFGAAVVHG
ncbi:MAG: hypothetical protein ACK559_03175, partial [bacterium]